MALLPSFLLLPLLLALARSLDSPEAPGGLEYKLPVPQYETEAEIAKLGKDPVLTRVPHTFLSLVVPQAFPEDIVKTVIQNKFDFNSSHDMIVTYELGIFICVFVGLLFIILMPLVGLCFCVCRSCGRCGGTMHQREKSNGPCLRRYYAISLLVICILISFGIFCVFMANLYLKNLPTNSWKLADSNIKDLRTFVNITPEQINYMVSQYHPTKERAISDLDNIKSLLGDRIWEVMRPKVVPVLSDVLIMAKVITRTREGLMYVNHNLTELKDLTRQLSSRLDAVKINMQQTLSHPACATQVSCENIRLSLSDLDDNNSIAQLPSLDDQVARINNVDRINFFSLVKKGNATFNDIPEMVQNQTQPFIADLKKKLNATGSKLDSIKEQLPVKDLVSTFTKHIDNLENNINPILSLMEEYDMYRWTFTMAVCFVLTLIVTFYFLGLLCGTVGYSKRATPTTRGCISNTGGIFLMVGVGLSFLFCWLIMVLVVFTFVFGVNVEKLVCEPYQDRKIFQILDTPYLLNEQWKYFLSGLIFGDPELALTFEETYNSCKENRGIYTTLKLDRKYNISEKLNFKELISTINREFDQVKINLSRIVLLDEKGKQGLKNFGAIGVDKINYDHFLTEINKYPTRGDLPLFVINVEEAANNLTQQNLQQDLLTQVQEVSNVHEKILIPLQETMYKTDSSLRELQKTTSNLEVQVDALISSLESTQAFISTFSAVAHNESRKYMNSIVSYFERYLQWALRSITEEIAACLPVATILDSAFEVFLCRSITDPINLFWFGLGMATFLLLPALIFGVKLAKYYRRMQSEDLYYDKRHAMWGLHRQYPMRSL